MKNVIKADKYRFLPGLESSRYDLTGRLVPVMAPAAVLTVILLTGCFDPDTLQTAYHVTIETEVTVHVEYNTGDETGAPDAGSDAGETGLPYGVTLQIDPAVLVPCDLERVVDGDTIIVHNPDGDRLRVRLTGINAPESVHEDESKNTEEGREASKYLKELLEDVDVVYLEYDEAEFDQYERTLAYVWIDTGDTYVMVNEIMLATDHAEPVYIKPNLRYADTFKQYEG